MRHSFQRVNLHFVDLFQGQVWELINLIFARSGCPGRDYLENTSYICLLLNGMGLEFSSKILGGSFLLCSLGSWLLLSVKGVYKMVGVFLFNFPLDGYVFCMPKYAPFLPKLAGDFLHHRNIKGKAAQCIYIVCIWQSSKALVC